MVYHIRPRKIIRSYAQVSHHPFNEIVHVLDFDKKKKKWTPPTREGGLLKTIFKLYEYNPLNSLRF